MRYLVFIIDIDIDGATHFRPCRVRRGLFMKALRAGFGAGAGAAVELRRQLSPVEIGAWVSDGNALIAHPEAIQLFVPQE